MPYVVLEALSLCYVSVVAAIIMPYRVLCVLSSHHIILGPGGPSREWVAVYISIKDLAAKEKVSKQKKKKRNKKSYWQ
jgi:hypothetical protein